MFSIQQTNDTKETRQKADNLFFQPNPANVVYRQNAELAAKSDMPLLPENYFFKPNKTPANIIQRIPIQGNGTPTSGQQVVNQTQTPSLSKRQIPQGAISRADFENYVTTYYGVADVHNGTKTEQEGELTPRNSVKPSISNWNDWSPGATSEDYSNIIQAIEDVAASFGAIPKITKIIFYEMYYETDPTGISVARSDVGASFGVGQLRIYKAYSKTRGFPVARSNAQGNYPPVGIAISGPGSSPGAPTPYQGKDKSLKESIAHELGHGIAEAAQASDPKALDNFNSTVGWVGTSSPALYDIGQQAVQSAITNNTAPPVQYKIEPSNWNDPKWIEQPMTDYSVIGGPGEDFAESIAAFVYANATLQARSPKRFKFISDGMPTWTQQMKYMPPIKPPAPVGDFPVTDQMKHSA
ncbi:MAG TPA: hypothetical protein VFE53_03810 [Mucilaginibacter sp.]|jgi:hypothetical protein|nr:hypothetical protein [Mucilaginibacter sp.]